MKDDPNRFFVPAYHIINALAEMPHTALALTGTTFLDRASVDRGLRWLKRRKLVHFDVLWKLTELGHIAFRANDKRAREEARRA